MTATAIYLLTASCAGSGGPLVVCASTSRAHAEGMADLLRDRRTLNGVTLDTLRDVRYEVDEVMLFAVDENDLATPEQATRAIGLDGLYAGGLATPEQALKTIRAIRAISLEGLTGRRP